MTHNFSSLMPILLALPFLIVWWIIKMLLKIAAPKPRYQYAYQRTADESPKANVKKKRFAQEDGEYVSYEEIVGERITSRTEDIYPDDRITDVKFEDIK